MTNWKKDESQEKKEVNRSETREKPPYPVLKRGVIL